ncbi:UNVERIFIED_CONTAM: hypothetical protein Slati_0602700 [Sesamum latifolium]|uniref:Uncharacterized protein n=1 Tax=Sesamum latifolium TaxID=2727402 RepID=A0AAW2Y1Z9_9LAMI
MGNISSCFYAQSHAAKLIDLQHNTLRLVDVPVTAAELMLEHPGYVVSPLIDFRRDFRLSAMKADEILSGSRVYMLISCYESAWKGFRIRDGNYRVGLR